jgi:hypothetical protein
MVNKLFKIAKVNLSNKTNEWLKKLNLAPTDWIELRTWIVQKYCNINVEDICIVGCYKK